ncbi:MAG: squalene/phytoene synthase family protein, partial [Merismopedia sp. SIO2A8]|nr:squalene/phytoene synthase family protein [Merismopedia sp. SIO2A8]
LLAPGRCGPWGISTSCGALSASYRVEVSPSGPPGCREESVCFSCSPPVLNGYCSTVGLMSSAVLGFDESRRPTPWSAQQERKDPLEEAISLGIAKQLTNILRDVGEDARRGRIYLPLSELALFDYTEKDLFNGVVDLRWRELMRFQIHRARKYYAQAERSISALSRDSRWPVWAALMLYKAILNVIERNQYDVFTQRAYVPRTQQLLYLPVAWLRAQAL